MTEPVKNAAAQALRALRKTKPHVPQNLAAVNAERIAAAAPCNCGQPDGVHKSRCPVRRREVNRKAKAKEK